MATEKRLIDANDAEKFAREHILDAKERFLILDFLRECSTVDAVEVVRCKDCKHYVAPQGVPCCDCFYGLGFPNKSGNDFCSYGERRDNDT